MKRCEWSSWDESLVEFTKKRKLRNEETMVRLVRSELKNNINMSINYQKMSFFLKDDQVPLDILKDMILSSADLSFTSQEEETIITKLEKLEDVETLSQVCEIGYKSDDKQRLMFISTLKPGLVQPILKPYENRNTSTHIIYEPIWRDFHLITKVFMNTVLCSLVTKEPARIICIDYLQWCQ
jgi:hypothetical protein